MKNILIILFCIPFAAGAQIKIDTARLGISFVHSPDPHSYEITNLGHEVTTAKYPAYCVGNMGNRVCLYQDSTYKIVGDTSTLIKASIRLLQEHSKKASSFEGMYKEGTRWIIQGDYIYHVVTINNVIINKYKLVKWK